MLLFLRWKRTDFGRNIRVLSFDVKRKLVASGFGGQEKTREHPEGVPASCVVYYSSRSYLLSLCLCAFVPSQPKNTFGALNAYSFAFLR